MTRAMLLACLPWTMLLLASLAVALWLIRLSRAKPEPARLRRLHADQQGGVESLSFVLTLPLFVMVMLWIVQISQLMIGQIVVEYAAFAAARAAVVWIPAYYSNNLEGVVEGWNCVNAYDDPAVPDGQVSPPYGGPSEGGKTHLLNDSDSFGRSWDAKSAKFKKIRMAAAMACMAVSPSRAYPGIELRDAETYDALRAAYAAVTPQSFNSGVAYRLRNKLAYTLAEGNLTVDVHFYHSDRELPLSRPFVLGHNPPSNLGVTPDVNEFRSGREVGWQDPITVEVKYKLALLPGPGRLLARYGKLGPEAQQSARARSRAKADVYSDVYAWDLSASATLGNEGEKPAYAHYYPINQY